MYKWLLMTCLVFSHLQVRPCALTEEPLGAPLLIDQGDVIKGELQFGLLKILDTGM